MTAFLIIGGIGLLLVLISLLVGDLLDGLFSLDALGGDLFSVTSIAAFTGAFGFGGALGLAGTDNMVLAIAVGVLVGSVATWGAVRLTKALSSSDQEAGFRSDSMIGHPALVITPVPEDGYGEVRISIAGQVRKLSARSTTPLPNGTEVWVSAILSPTAVEVAPTTPELTP